MNPVRTYYSRNDDLEVVKLLVREREPVNIAFKRPYVKKELNDVFGWTTGFYDRYYRKHKKLAPNIAVYTPTFVNYDGNTDTRIHVIHSVGLAFDTAQQPDFKFFQRTWGQKNLLINVYVEIFRKIYICARDQALSTVVMSIVGGNNFASLYPGGRTAFQTEIWAKAFFKVFQENKDLNTVFMGSDDQPALSVLRAKHPFIDIGWFPDNIEWVDVHRTLFVNAWDPLSIPGNGNAADQSLDGFIGRVTNIAVNGTLMTNPFMTFKACDVSWA
jgi:hypothetical protein